MSDFEKDIRDQFNKEVQPQFEASQWDAYVLHRDRKKKKRRIAILFFLGIGLLGATLWIVPSSYSDSPNMKDVDDRREILSTKKPMTSDSVTILENSKSDPETSVVNITSGDPESVAQTASISRSVEEKIVLHQVSIDHSGQLAEDNQSFTVEQLENVNDVEKSLSQTSLKPEQIQVRPESTLSLQSTAPAYQHSEITASDILWSANLSETIERPKVTFDQVVTVNKARSKFYGRAYIGLSLPSHVQIAEEQASQFGLALFYTLAPKWRVGLNVELAYIGFVSSAFEDRLGIPSLEAPSTDVRFAQAVVESSSLTPTINAEYLWFQQRRWSSYIGVGYGFSAELYRELEYEFEGDDNSSDDDDISIISSKKDHYLVPKYMQILSGIEYQINPRLGLHMTVVLPVQLNDDQIDLLRKLQVNLGVSSSF